MKPLAGGLAKLRGEFEVMMGADGINVAKISRQMRQLGLHVYPLIVPALEHQNGGAVSKIMDAWGMALRVKHLGAGA